MDEIEIKSADGAGYLRHLGDSGRYMTRRSVLPDDCANAIAQLVIELNALAQHHEQDHPHVVVPVLADCDALDNFGAEESRYD